MKSRILKLFLVIIGCLVILVIILGFKKSNNLEHSAFVVAIGIDKSPTDEEKILVTFQIIPPQVAQDSSSNLSKAIVTTLDEYSINSAIGKIQNYMSTLINFSHTRVIVFSEEIAKEGIIRYVNSIASSSQFDTNMYIMVSSSPAKEYLESLPEKTEINPILYYNIIKNSEEYNSSTRTITLTEFLKSYYAPFGHSISPMCSVLSNSDNENKTETGNTNEEKDKNQNESGDNSSESKSGDKNSDKSSDNNKGGAPSNEQNNKISEKSDIKIEIGGIAVFNKDKMVGSLSKEDAIIYNMLSNKIKNAYIKINHPNKENQKEITSNIYLWQSKKRKIKIDINSLSPVIDITIPVNAGINDTEVLEYSFYDENYINNMKKYINEELKKMSEEYFTKVQKEYGVDINDFHKILRKNFLFKKDYMEFNWNEKYKDAKININFDIKFISPGLSTIK